MPADHAYCFLIHDRDRIFSQQLDQQVQHLGLRVLKPPVRSPQANALCERLLGTLRRECLDFLIPLTQSHVRHLLHDWALHYNTVRTWPWVRGSRSHLRTCRLHGAHTGIGFRRIYGSRTVRSSVGCTTNINWKRKWRDGAVRLW